MYAGVVVTRWYWTQLEYMLMEHDWITSAGCDSVP